MFYSKVTALFAIVLLFAVSVSSNPYRQKPERADPCLIQRRCSFEEIVVRALSDNNCVLFRNECLFTNDLCERRANNQPDLKVVDRGVCRSKCIEVCGSDFSPVCAEHDGAEHTFSNRCNLNKLACERDKSYIFSYDGECKNAVSTN